MNLFGKKKVRRRQREDDFVDYDERYDEYADEDYDDGYDEDDYPDEEFEEEYGDQVDERYEDEEYPEDDRYEDDRYEEDRYEDDDYPEDDRDYEAEDDYDSDYEPRRDERYEDEEDYPDDDRYEDDRYEDERYADDDYEDGDYADEDDYDYDYDREDDRYADDDYYAGGRGSRGSRGGRGGRDDRRSRRGRDRDRDGESVGAKILAFLGNTSVAERAAAVVAVLLLAGGIAFMSFYAKAKNYAAEVGSFAEVGADLQIDGVVGSSGLLAIADAEMARAMAAGLVEEIEEEEEEVPDTASNVTIKMTLTSIKSDMKIKFINSETKKLVANVPFVVSVVTPDGTKVSYDDHDRDGIIYKKDLTAGKYKITPEALSSEYDSYKLDTSTQTLTVKDTVEMKAVDVSNEIKKESQINAAKEDTAVQTQVESVLNDTVEWVDSNQNSSNSDGSTYEKIDKSKLDGILVGAALKNGSVKRMAATRARTGTENGEPKEGEGEQQEQPEVKKLELSESSVTVEEGSSTTVTASGNTEGLSCTSSDSCATASVSGTTITINGVSAGTATVTVSAGDDSKTISVTVKAKPKEKVSIKFDSSSVTMKAEETKSVTITEGPSDPQCSSSDSSVATVSVSGKTITITAKGKGEAKISVKGNDDYLDTDLSVSVSDADPKAMTLSVNKLSIKKGGQGAIDVTGPAAIESCTPASNNNIAKATISGNKITIDALNVGTEKFTVKAKGYSDATFDIEVTSADKKNMKASPSDETIKIKKDAKTTITFSEPTDLSCEVDKDGKDVVKVEKDGAKFNITGLKVGTAKLTFKDSKDDYNPYPVTVVVEGLGELKLKVSRVTLVPGKTYKIETTDSNVKPTYESSKTSVATVDSDGKVKAVAEGETTITAKYSDKTATVTVKVISGETDLKDKDGNVLYVIKSDGTYRKATYADLFDSSIKDFYIKKAGSGIRQGWWTIDGKTYYYNKYGEKVTGEQVIKGARYTFGSDGALSSSSGTMGIDVSKWNGNINWAQVKNAGVNYAIIRCGYRGSSAGALIEDPKFKANIQGAQAAGIKVGVYFFSQAVNEVEAVEEASMCINLCKGYNLSFPVYIDVEGSNGRGDQISASQRTANIKAFCGTIQSAGYRAGVYSNKTWFTQKMNASALTSYKIWLAQYAANVTYTATRYDMWQYTSKGSISGISGNVDMNILYN
ncbi:hypothetical protein D6855_12335 [Butyrivibrio sp. CB08]|uniref:GH25 family lysozyme n=1 Tax=Butyrivibrio sp. CB08 TaxID=2364879 RepID=UPI000EAA1FB6|nr:GH25 family lysozyme [Butyrivibrio sp. CB08]RKM57831.1 hypothetical protein D6855_12335 [Butyrivibrio sp. CB08]